jgi:branched-subunit amino acid transport protein
VTDRDGTRSIQLGIETLAVVVTIALVVWRRNLLLGLVVAVVIVAVSRATGIG